MCAALGESFGGPRKRRHGMNRGTSRAAYHPNKRPSRARPALILAAVLLCGLLVALIVLGDGVRLALGPCTPGREGAAEGVSGDARELLETPNFEASPKAIGDLKAGVVDPRLVNALQTVAEEHRICVDAFKEGHYFLPGVPDGPLIPDSYGEAGGLTNTHYYGRAADIRRVNGKRVRGNGGDPEILDIGEIIAGIPPQQRPDQIIGPSSWTNALDRSYGEGWILDADQLKLHEDHLHIGYRSDDGTQNTR